MKITNRTVIGRKNAVTVPYLEFQLQNVRFLQIYCDFFPCNGFCGGVHTKGNEPICKKKKKERKKKNLLTEGSVIKRLVRKEKHAQLLLSAKRGYCCRRSFYSRTDSTVWKFKNFSVLQILREIIFGQLNVLKYYRFYRFRSSEC